MRQSETLLSPGGDAALPKPLLPPGAAAPASNGAVLSPRKVETFTITPDGRIVSQPAETPQTPAGGETDVAANAPLDVPTLPSVLQPAGTPETAGPSLRVMPEVNDAAPRTPVLPGGGTASLVPSPQPKPRPTTRDLDALRQAEAQTQAQQPRAEPTPAAAASALDGKFAVQVASNQRQADSLAIFADLQRRYPDLVQGYRPLIQRADLGSRGIFYRLRIGPIESRSEANQLCGSLRNAGLPGCIVRSL
jgi:cell division septation protein DedD